MYQIFNITFENSSKYLPNNRYLCTVPNYYILIFMALRAICNFNYKLCIIETSITFILSHDRTIIEII